MEKDILELDLNERKPIGWGWCKKIATTRSSRLENFSTAYSLVVNCLSFTNV